MKNIITIAVILFCIIFSFAQDNSIPSSVLKKTYQIEGGIVFYGSVLLNNHAFVMVNAVSDSIWLSDSLLIQKGEYPNYYLIKYDLDFNMEDILQISGNIGSLGIQVENNKLLLSGKLLDDTIVLDDQILVHGKYDYFHIAVSENFNLLSNYFLGGDVQSSEIVQNENITYMAGRFGSEVIFKKDTLFSKIGMEVGAFFLLAVKNDELVWSAKVENIYNFIEILGMELVQDEVVIGANFFISGPLIMGHDTIDFGGFGTVLKFDSEGKLLWNSSDMESFRNLKIYDFQEPNNIYFQGYDSLYHLAFGCIDAKDGSLKWKKEMKGNCNLISMQVDGNDLYMTGVYEDSLGFKDVLLDSVTGNYNAFFFHYNISNSKADLYSIAGNNTDYCFGLSVDKGEILISGFSESDHLFPDEFQLDFQQNSSYLALLDMTKLTNIVEIDKSFNIFPNPIQSGDYLKIISDKTSKDSHIKIVNNLGQIVYSLENGLYFQIPKYLQSGIYYLMIEDGKRSELHKLIVE